MLKAEAKPERAESSRRGRADKLATEGRQRAIQTVGMLSGRCAAGEFEPGCGGDVSHATDVDGAAQGARGGAWGPSFRAYEPWDASHGGWQGVFGLRGEDRRQLRGRQAAVGGAQGSIGRAAQDRGFPRCWYVRVAWTIREVRGGASEGFDLCEDGTFGGDPGDDPQRRGAARSHAGDAPPRDREPAALRGRTGARRRSRTPVHQEGYSGPNRDR